jgi:hypothetical protein
LGIGQTGYVLNHDKSQLRPTQDLVYLGGRLRPDLGLVLLPEDRRVTLFTLVQSFLIGNYRTARVWLSLLGTMAAVVAVVPLARLSRDPYRFAFCRVGLSEECRTVRAWVTLRAVYIPGEENFTQTVCPGSGSCRQDH